MVFFFGDVFLMNISYGETGLILHGSYFFFKLLHLPHKITAKEIEK